MLARTRRPKIILAKLASLYLPVKNKRARNQVDETAPYALHDPIHPNNSLLPGDDAARTRRGVFDFVLSIGVRQCKVRMIKNADEASHPGMNVADHFDPNPIGNQIVDFLLATGNNDRIPSRIAGWE